MSLRSSAETLTKSGYDWALRRWRTHSPAGRAVARRRAACDRMLNDLARSAGRRFEGTVLVDAMWDNPNYWLRYALLRAGLGLSRAREIGLLGEYKRNECRDTLEAFGIREVESYRDIPVSDTVSQQADRLLAETRSAEDILHWTLPNGVHPALVYDGILKRQRLASVDVGRSDFREHVIEALSAINRADKLLDRHAFDLLVISHPLNFSYGLLAWAALSRGITVVVPFGLFGVLRFMRMREPHDLFRFYDKPSLDEIAALPQGRSEHLARAGRDYLRGRMSGRADDLAAIFAYTRNNRRIDRAELCARYGWDPQKPIVGFYGSNWYDWPHQLGMTQFRDFLDWTEATFETARANDRVNWLFKPHPAEDWFGGIGLSDILARLGTAPQIAIADKSWGNDAVMNSIDALITYHGTAGIEFAALGKPVLVPDRGRYEDFGFVTLAPSRQAYIEMLGRDWWRDIDLEQRRRAAEIFAGLCFCAPDWQGDFILADDSRQDELYKSIPPLVADNPGPVTREIDALGQWWKSGLPYYHTSKMLMAEDFRVTNIK